MPAASLRHATAVIVLTTAIALLGFQAVSPALPGMRDALGIPTTQIGWVMTAYALPAFVFVPLAGLWADRYGKKVVLVPSLILFGAAGGAIQWAPDAASVFVLRFFQGIGGAALITLNYALLGDLFSGPTRTRVAGWIGVIQNAGSSAVPIVAGALAAVAWFWPFALSWLSVAIAIYTAVWLVEPKPEPEPGAAPRAQGRAFLGHAWRHLADRAVVETLVMTAGFIFVGFGALITYLPLYMADTFGASAVAIGLVMGARIISGVAIAAVLEKVERLMSRRLLIAASFLATAVSVGIVPLLPNTPGLLVSSIIYGAAFGVIRPMLQLMLLDFAPPDLRATLSSAGTFFLRLGQAASPVAAGLYLVVGTYDGLYYWSATIAFGFAIYAFFAKALAPPPRGA